MREIFRNLSDREKLLIKVLLGFLGAVIAYFVIIMPIIQERVVCRVRGGAGLTHDVGPVTSQITAAIQIGQSHDAIGRLQGRIVSVFLVGQGLILEGGYGVRGKDAARARVDAGAGLGGAGHGHEQDGDDQGAKTGMKDHSAAHK